VVLPPGKFMMGYEEGPQHEVRIGYRFAVGRFPVTFEEYDRFAAEIGRGPPKDENWGRGRRPVINVYWDDAQAYVRWLSKETGQLYWLLSEAEWEYACRAGTTTPATGAARPMNKRRHSVIFWAGVAIFLVAVLAMTQVVRNEYPFFAGYVILQFIALAVAWSILGGYAGYVNFGTNAFFGVGVYTAVALVKATGAPLLVQIAVAAIVGMTLGLAVGLLTLRMRGIFFSIATIALAIIIETVVMNWRFVGGAAGIQIQRPPVMAPFDSYVKMLFFVQAVLAVTAIAIARYIQNSRIGRGLQALRDDELAAECTGVPTLRLKLVACMISGGLISAAGAPAAMYLQYADPSSAFNLTYSVSALAMALIGGTAHWIGPVLGAILLGSTQQFLAVTISSEVNVLVLGIMLVLFVVGAPKGIIGLLRPRYRLRAGGKP
jgi:branched-chain amino acid transport system permease protein